MQREGEGGKRGVREREREVKKKKKKNCISSFPAALSIFIAPSRLGEIRSIRKRVSAVPKLAITQRATYLPFFRCIQKISDSPHSPGINMFVGIRAALHAAFARYRKNNLSPIFL